MRWIHIMALLVGLGALCTGCDSESCSCPECDLPQNPAVTRIGPAGTHQYPSIQEAVDAAVDGDEIVLPVGRYTGAGNRGIRYLGRAITVRSETGDPRDCVIDCEGKDRGFLFDSDESSEAKLEGITIAHGAAPANLVGERWGGAVVCGTTDPPGAIPTIRNCIFRGNQAATGGGAIYSSGDGGLLEGCTFLGNVAGFGGAVSAVSGELTLRGCTLYGNTAARGSGVACDDGSGLGILSTIIAFGNTGAAVDVDAESSITASCCDLYGNAGGDWTGRLAGLADGGRNVSADPLFVDPGEFDLRLSPESPCSPDSSGCEGMGAWPVATE